MTTKKTFINNPKGYNQYKKPANILNNTASGDIDNKNSNDHDKKNDDHVKTNNHSKEELSEKV